ncbi:MAG: DeoR family transcriptional regulator [Verrucomicrobiota bacterium]|nr:DeoR family transcriptional regulator [Verrucomicrobiota bacterium]
MIQMIEENNRVTVSNIATECKVNEKTIKRDIEKLKNQGILCRIGSSNSGYWQIIETKK